MRSRRHVKICCHFWCDPKNRTAVESLGSLYLAAKKWDDARDWYLRQLSIDPNDAYYTLGFIAWSKWYPAYRLARERSGMRPDEPGSIRDPQARAKLRSEWCR